MRLMDEIRKLTRPYSDTEDDFDDFDEELPEEEPQQPDPAPYRPAPNYGRPAAAPVADARPAAGRVVNINTGVQLQVVLFKPERFDQVSEIAGNLRDKKAVILNLESTNKDVARRLVDFLSGCAFALDGNVKKIAIATYLVAPYNVGVVDNYEEEAETTESTYF